ncbi:MAG TPA: hypothetical protein VF171_06665 [Trueperaceae bacterium]
MLYRRERRTPLWLAIVISLVVALPLGFWLGRATAPHATLHDVLAPAHELVREAAGALDIVLLEYGRAQQGNEASLKAARSAAARSRSRLEEAAPALAALYPERYRRARTAEISLQEALAAQAPQEEVSNLVKELQQRLADLLPELAARTND